MQRFDNWTSYLRYLTSINTKLRLALQVTRFVQLSIREVNSCDITLRSVMSSFSTDAPCNPPMFGLGLWKIPNDVTCEVVYEAIKIGVRHLDSASDYGNEIEVGQGEIINLFIFVANHSILIY